MTKAPTSTKTIHQTKKSIRKTKEESVILEDVYNEIYELVNKITTIAARMDEMEVNSKIDQFFNCNPPFFGEDIDPFLATDWIYLLESIFDLINCPDEKKVPLAVLRLKDAALSWWILTKRGLEQSDRIQISWMKFKKLFYENYFPGWMKLEKLKQLCNIAQGYRSVAEYDAEFTKLCILVDHYIPNDAWKASLFVRGLRLQIRTQLCVAGDMSCQEVRDAALRFERQLNARDDRSDQED